MTAIKFRMVVTFEQEGGVAIGRGPGGLVGARNILFLVYFLINY